MTVKVQVGPPQISIHQGQTVLITEEDGQINWPSDKGLYFLDTRIVSSWRIYANGEPWELLNGGAISYYASWVFLTSRSFLTEDGTIPPCTLGLTLSRCISATGDGPPARWRAEGLFLDDFIRLPARRGGRRGPVPLWPRQSLARASFLGRPRRR